MASAVVGKGREGGLGAGVDEATVNVDEGDEATVGVDEGDAAGST
jgi:hypothetical protein